MKNELLEKVMNDRLTKAIDERLDPEERSKALEEGLEVADRYIQLEKIELDESIQLRKIELDESIQLRKIEDTEKENNKNRTIKYIEVAVPVGLLILDGLFKRYFMRQVCNFEKDYTFTTTPGRSISGLFRFK